MFNFACGTEINTFKPGSELNGDLGLKTENVLAYRQLFLISIGCIKFFAKQLTN